MKMDEVAGSQNDEFYTPTYAVMPLLKYVHRGSTVWCPFDTEQSLIVKALREHGCTVTATHLSTGQDFFTTPMPVCDCIISNPPYSLKAEVFARLFTLRRPFAMIVGVVGLFESEGRFSMFKENHFEVMYLNRRVSYYRSYADAKPALNPPFSSVWVCQNMLPDRLVFERIAKK